MVTIKFQAQVKQKKTRHNIHFTKVPNHSLYVTCDGIGQLAVLLTSHEDNENQC